MNTGPLAGLRNQLINGQFEIWQRGTSITSNSPVYTADRWYVSGAPGSNPYTVERSQTAPVGFPYSLSIPSGTFTGLQQGIEIQNTKGSPFAENSQWTLSFWCDKLPTSAFLKWRATVGNDGNSADAANFSGFTAGDTSGTFTKYTTTFTILSTRPSSSQICLNVAILLDDSLGGHKIAGVQLEPGPVATPFELRPIGLELSLCQRYYYNCQTTGANPSNNRTYTMGTGTNAGTAFYNMTGNYPVTMRVVPSIIVATPEYGIGVAGLLGKNGLNRIAASNTSIHVLNEHSVSVIANDTTGDATTAGLWYNIIADAEF